MLRLRAISQVKQFKFQRRTGGHACNSGRYTSNSQPWVQRIAPFTSGFHALMQSDCSRHVAFSDMCWPVWDPSRYCKGKTSGHGYATVYAKPDCVKANHHAEHAPCLAGQPFCTSGP